MRSISTPPTKTTKNNETKRNQMCSTSIILFCAPKQGGIMQSSGFLDLKSLMALGLTCKANMYDELSLIVLIENEITRDHGASTMEEAIAFWRTVSSNPWLRQWFNRDWTVAASESIAVTPRMLSEATCYDVMMAKMLRTDALHRAAFFGNIESIRDILSFYPEPQQAQAVMMRDRSGGNVLHYAARAYSLQTNIHYFLDLLSESHQCLQALNMTDRSGRIVLHYAAQSGNAESVKTILALYPESHHSQILAMQDIYGGSIMHHAAESGNSEIVRFLH